MRYYLIAKSRNAKFCDQFGSARSACKFKAAASSHKYLRARCVARGFDVARIFDGWR